MQNLTQEYSSSPVGAEQKRIITKTKLYDNTISVNTASIDITNISQDYDHLILETRIRMVTTSTDIRVLFNDDTTDTNYLMSYMQQGSSGTFNAPWLFYGANNSLSDIESVQSAILYDYKNTSKYTKCISSGLQLTTNTSGVIKDVVVFWKNSSAVTKISIIPNSVTDFASGSSFILYGIKEEFIGGTYQLITSSNVVYEYEVTGSSQATIDIPASALGKDKYDFILYTGDSVAVATKEAYIYVNNDVTPANYTTATDIFGVVGSARFDKTTDQLCTVIIPIDDTKPQSNEGDEIMTVTYTPKYPDSILRVEAIVGGRPVGTNVSSTISLFRDSDVDALSVSADYSGTQTQLNLSLSKEVLSNNTQATTFKIRAGASSGNIYINANWVGGRLYGGVWNTYIQVTEYRLNGMGPDYPNSAFMGNYNYNGVISGKCFVTNSTFFAQTNNARRSTLTDMDTQQASIVNDGTTVTTITNLQFATNDAGGFQVGAKIQIIDPTLTNSAKTGIVGTARSEISTVVTITGSNIPWDNSIPQSNEGQEILTVTYTPKYADSILHVEGSFWGSFEQDIIATALFRDSNTDADAVTMNYGSVLYANGVVDYEYPSNATVATTFKVRMGGNGTGYLNAGSTGGAVYGGKANSFLRVTEIRV